MPNENISSRASDRVYLINYVTEALLVWLLPLLFSIPINFLSHFLVP